MFYPKIEKEDIRTAIIELRLQVDSGLLEKSYLVSV
jgi:hypothetical protein